MAQNITILGASYSNVPAVTLPKTGGGTARFTDVSDSTVTESTVLAGYKAYNASGAAIVGTSTAGTMIIRDTQDSHGGTVREITAGSVVTGTKSITSNGTYDVAAYADASVNVPSPEPELQSKTATPTESQQTITPDSGYDGLSSVTVGAISSTYVGTGITRRSSSDLTGSLQTSTYDVTAPSGYYSSNGTFSIPRRSASNLTTSVSNGSLFLSYDQGYYPGGGKSLVSAMTSTDLSASGATVTVPAGYYAEQASKTVASGSAGTPTATKGTVSNHSVAVTPSVTNSTGYITGGTKTGTAVTVAASELVSGTLNITSSGTKDVTNYASASVAAGSATASATKGSVSNHSISVTPSVTRTAGYVAAGTANGTAVTVSASELVSGTLSVTENDTYDVTNYANVEVDVSNSTTYTATITRVGSGTNPRVQVNGTGTTYSANGATFTFSEGDYLYFYIGPSDYSRKVYVNDVLVSQDVTYYTWYPPCYDIGIEFEDDSNNRIVRITTPTISITSSGQYDVSEYAVANVNVRSGSYTATINETGNINRCFVQVNDTGDRYYANGTTFTFTDTDEIVFHCSGSKGGGTITLNGTVVAQHSYNTVSFTLASPRTDMTISMAYNTVSTIAITVPELSITEDGKYSVVQYAYVDVETPSYQSEFKSLIDRTITSLTLPSNLTTIGNSAFRGCTNLVLTSLPSGLTSIDTYAFYGCTNLALTSLPSGITSIGGYTFYGCTNLALTSLPSGVASSIGGYAFYNCTNLVLTSLPSGVTSIGGYAFYGCTNLALTSLPSGLTNIETYAFYDCTNLALTSLPSTLTSISSYAFARCESIVSIQSNAAITTLGTSAFTGYSSHPSNLKTVRFPNMALTSNLSTVFGSTTASSACQLLETCDIGSTTGIAANSFANCYKLQTLVLRKTASVCTLANVSAFTNTPMRGYGGLTGTVYVPSALISSYQTATNWATLYNNGTVTFSAIEGSQWAL